MASIIYCRPCGYEKRAREAAAALREQLGLEAALVPGREKFYERFGFRRMTTAMAIFENPEQAYAHGYLERP